jgi:hypothetical protein
MQPNQIPLCSNDNGAEYITSGPDTKGLLGPNRLRDINRTPPVRIVPTWALGAHSGFRSLHEALQVEHFFDIRQHDEFYPSVLGATFG